MISVPDLFHKGSYFVDQHSAAILTGIGVVGVATTAVLTGRASIKAYELIMDEENSRIFEANKDKKAGDTAAAVESLTSKETARLVWKEFVPPILAGSGTIFAIIMANRLASKEVAAMAAAYTLSDRAFQEYKEKVTQKFGENKEQAVRDEVAQERVNKNPPGSHEVILAGTGDVLCMDLYSGRYFQSSMEKIRQAENKINFEIINHSYSSLSSFYDELGLPATEMSDMLGWNLENRIEIKFSTAMTTDQRPCLTISFHIPPAPDYGKHVY